MCTHTRLPTIGRPALQLVFAVGDLQQEPPAACPSISAPLPQASDLCVDVDVRGQHCYVRVAVVPAHHACEQACAAGDALGQSRAGSHLLRTSFHTVLHIDTHDNTWPSISSGRYTLHLQKPALHAVAVPA